MQNRRIVVLLSAVLGLMATVCQAQNTITFTATDARSAASMTLDSIHILNLSRGRDTTITGTTFPVDWPLTTGVGEIARPGGLSISGNYPNSFGDATAFSVGTSEVGVLSIAVFGMNGTRVAEYRQSLQPGQHEFAFAAGGLPDGVYFATASLNGQTSTLKLLKSGRSAGGNPQIVYRNWSAAVAAPLRRTAAADLYTYIGYAAGYFPAVLAEVLPAAGRSYEFSLLPLTSRGISTGATVPVYEMDVPTTGGTVNVSTEDCPIKGMEITVPDSAFAEHRTFSISYAQVQSHSYGANFNPVSPMIVISNGGGYSDEPMIIKIPVKVPSDEFAMAFLYNELTGTLEGMPILAADASSITVATRHFATSQISTFAPDVQRASKRTADAFANIIISSIRESSLKGQQILTTGFTPGKDDWEFSNRGSVIASGGHCAGQSLSMMWYYYEKKLHGASQLFHSLDRLFIPSTNGDSLWMDNPKGYKFASIIQKEYGKFNGWMADQLRQLRDSSVHAIGWRAFLYSMLLTGEPQYVSLRARDTDGSYFGHAIVAHKISVTEKKLFVTDPNYPGQERSILFSDPYFAPYDTKQNANEPASEQYPWIAYIAKSCLINWSTITARYAEVQAGTIGTVSPHSFPQVRLIDNSENAVISASTDYVSNRDTLVITAHNAQTAFAVYDATSGERLVPGAKSPYGLVYDSVLVLKPGVNEFGVYFAQKVDNSWVYADYQWLTVIYNQLTPHVATISPTQGTAGDVLTINGSNFGNDRSKGEVHLYTTSRDMILRNVVSWDTNRIVVTVPDDAISGKVYVKVNGLESEYRVNSGHLQFTFKPGPAIIQSVTPDHGYGGDQITIKGKRFGKGLTGSKIVINNYDLFPNNPSEIPSWTDSLITIILPKTCIGGDLQMVNWSDESKSSNVVQFTMDQPVISGYGPASGPDQTLVTISGNFLGESALWTGTGVTVGGVKPILDNWSRTAVSFYASQSGEIVLTVCGKSIVVGNFTKTP
ncbi:MAG: IPT/TIG domain-containing protein [Bacteroidia bacterium]|nr:IPT/TIG domain-containing protein [Bacteroidia bacterium]